MSKTLLIVDCHGEYPSLRTLTPGCGIFSAHAVCDSLEKAVELAKECRFSALVLTAAAAFPELRDFLGYMDEHQPECAQFIRSEAQTCLEVNEGKVRPCHWLAANLSPAALESAVKTVFLREELNRDAGLQALVGKMEEVPSIPSLYLEITTKLQSPDTSLDDIAVHISHDPAMSALLLRLANSAGYGLAESVKTVSEAIQFLGTEQTRSLILFSRLFSLYQRRPCPGFSLDEFWLHSIWTATYSRWIVQEETGNSAQAEAAFAAGMLHDIGRLLLAANLPRQMQTLLRTLQRSPQPYWDLEREQLGATHAEIGALLLADWGLPYEILEAVAFHHFPSRAPESPHLGPLTAVHVANAFSQAKEMASALETLDMAYLHRIYPDPPLETWKSLCGMDLRAREEA